jgi:ketosteroid isomerase-like protein
LDLEAKIGERTDDWQRAIEARDPDAAAQFLADDYALVVIQPERTVMHRDEWLKLLPDYDVRRYTVERRLVEASHDIASVFQRVDQTAVVKGAERSGVFILSDIWVSEAGEWRVWRRHSTPLSAGPMPRA